MLCLCPQTQSQRRRQSILCKKMCVSLHKPQAARTDARTPARTHETKSRWPLLRTCHPPNRFNTPDCPPPHKTRAARVLCFLITAQAPFGQHTSVVHCPRAHSRLQHALAPPWLHWTLEVGHVSPTCCTEGVRDATAGEAVGELDVPISCCTSPATSGPTSMLHWPHAGKSRPGLAELRGRLT